MSHPSEHTKVNVDSPHATDVEPQLVLSNNSYNNSDLPLATLEELEQLLVNTEDQCEPLFGSCEGIQRWPDRSEYDDLDPPLESWEEGYCLIKSFYAGQFWIGHARRSITINDILDGA